MAVNTNTLNNLSLTSAEPKLGGSGSIGQGGVNIANSHSGRRGFRLLCFASGLFTKDFID